MDLEFILPRTEATLRSTTFRGQGACPFGRIQPEILIGPKVNRNGTAGSRIRDWREFYSQTRPPEDMLRWAASHASVMAELMAYGRVLEVGTGTGMLSGLLGRGTPLVVTLDDNIEVLRTASVFHDRVRAQVRSVRGDAFRLPFGDATFDAVFSQGLLEHFDPPDVRQLVAEQLRIAPVAYTSVPSRWYPHMGHWGPGLIGNERLLTRREWLELLDGFHVEVRYYADYKLATFAGRTLPWPNQLLIRAVASG